MSAVEWLNKTLTETGAIHRETEAYLVLAMAHHQLKQPDEARSFLARGVEIVRKMHPRLEDGQIRGHWVNWIITHALMDEAKALIEGSQESEDE